MYLKIAAVASAGLLALGAMAPETAMARHYHHYRHYHGYAAYNRGYRNCSSGDGAVGTIAGGVGGALIGNAVGGGTLGTIGGGVGGALLGRTLDKENTRSRHGC